MRNPSEALAAFSDVPIRISAEVGRLTLAVSDIVSLKEGSILRTSKSAGESLELYFGGIRTAVADVVTVNGAVVLRITGFHPAGGIRKSLEN